MDLDGSLKKWMERKKNKYTSPIIQIEILQLLALKILRDVVSNIQKGFFSIMCDECTYSSNKEQLVICLRWVDQRMDVHESFIGLYVLPNINVETLNAIKDTLVRLNLGFSHCREQCYNGQQHVWLQVRDKI